MCYFSNIFEFPTATIECICHALKNPRIDRPDFLVGCGLSGSLALVPVSTRSGIPCGIIRKTSDQSHSFSTLELGGPYTFMVNRYVIIDDLISSGDTIHHITHEMTRRYPHSRCVGIILYQESEDKIVHKDGYDKIDDSIPMLVLEHQIHTIAQESN